LGGDADDASVANKVKLIDLFCVCEKNLSLMNTSWLFAVMSMIFS